MRVQVPAALLLLLLGTAAVVPVAGTNPPAVAPANDHSLATGQSVTPSQDTELTVSYTYERLPERPAVVGVRMRIPASAMAERATIEFRDDVTVVDTTNVESAGTGYRPTGDGAAEIVYRLPFDWKYTGNSADSWTLLEHRSPTIETGNGVSLEEQVDAVDGYVGNRTLLLGAHDVSARQADGERIELVVPEGVDLLYGVNRTVEALANASRALRIGGRAPVVHAFVTPEVENEVVPFVQPGFGLDDRTLLVDADSELDVWTHEYVHTRQAFPETDGLRWLVEGSAEYYGWLLSIQQGYDGWTPLQQVFRRAQNDDSVLADPDTWSGEVDYNKGGHVLAVVDRAVRRATEGEQTLQDALRRTNRDNATLESFRTAIREVGGPAVAETATRLVRTRAAPEYQPDADQLASVYGYAAPDLRVRTTSLSTAGPNWSRSLDTLDGQLRVGLTESLRITARVTNDGDVPGVATVAPTVSADESDLVRADSPWVGRVGPNESVVQTATHRFRSPGQYEIDQAGLPFTVRVVPERGTAAVTALNVVQTASADDVTVEARVRNDGRRSTFVTLPVRRDGQRVSTTALVLDGDTNRTVVVRRNVSTRTSATIAVSNVSTTVGKPPVTDTPGRGSTARTQTRSDADGPDGRPVVAVLAVLAVAVVLGLAVRRFWADERE